MWLDKIIKVLKKKTIVKQWSLGEGAGGHAPFEKMCLMDGTHPWTPTGENSDGDNLNFYLKSNTLVINV